MRHRRFQAAQVTVPLAAAVAGLAMLIVAGCRRPVIRAGVSKPPAVAPSAADAALAEGDDQTALPILQREAAARPQDALLLMKLGACYGRLGRYEAATKTYLQAIRSLKSGSFQASSTAELTYRETNKARLLAECYFSAGLAQLRLGDAEEAQALCDKAGSADASYAGVHDLQGQIWEARGQTEKAVQEYRQLLALAPKYADGYERLGHAFAELGRIDEAREEYERCLEQAKDAEQRQRVEQALASLGEEPGYGRSP